VKDGLLCVLVQVVIVTDPDLRVVQSVPAIAAGVDMASRMVMDTTRIMC
jgi:hypothetical protein